ncbi:tetratricopeptide repeat protein [Microcoleus sp. FACHB-672]|uniref:tetratricopeptide repeat protein n=1 Tax=Microcoleus sp. FACHB-672 TaxID=2692825 RepID=UPI0016856A1C|nr:tetratricopeptide repeat protein [Microcoleus sp. FACHB-672]MBD2039407.1 tetratricopeptide repeat protein [Microcoleus sp. FACHB-672]
MKKFRYWLLFCSIFTLSLTGCSGVKKLSAGVTKLLTPPHIAKLTPSLVLITHEKGERNGTGFFVAGEKNVCTVLTTRHVIGMSSQVQLQTHDLKVWGANKVRLFPNHDLALVMFDSGSQHCSYKALELGNSESFKVGDNAYISGFAKKTDSGKIDKEFVASRVLSKEDFADGYDISYSAMTPKEMSGSPVFDKIGKVVAVHGIGGLEASFLAAHKASKQPQKPPSKVNTNFDKAEVSPSHSKWAIPINIYLANVHKPSIGDAASVRSAQEWLKLGHDFQPYQFEEDALAAYDKAIQIKPDFADAWLSRGFALSNLKRYEAAVTSYDKAIQMKSGFARAWFGRGWALYHLKRYEDAVASYDKAIQMKSNYGLALMFRGNALYDLKRYEDAVASYDKAIQINPNNADAWFKRGNALYDLKRYEDAVASYDKTFQVNSIVVVTALWFKQGNALYGLKRYKDAVAAYDKATQIQPQNADAWYNRGLALSSLKRYEDAVASYDKAIQIKSEFAVAWYNRGFALYDLKRYKDAVASFDKVIQITPNDAEAWNFRGMMLFMQGRNKEALESVEKALQINPNLQYAQELRKTILQQLGR